MNHKRKLIILVNRIISISFLCTRRAVCFHPLLGEALLVLREHQEHSYIYNPTIRMIWMARTIWALFMEAAPATIN